jgi:hypothetical protein
MPDRRLDDAIDLLDRFAERTGLVSARTPQRYLWTDALAACTWFGLARTTEEPRFRELAVQLIDAVHTTLGRHRADDARRGWLSGLDDEQARHHPTRGGLRIGKPLPEQNPYDLLDAESEWDRDGQYFHYLTKWMHALDQAARATGDWRFNVWARELAVRAFEAFSYAREGGGAPRLYWKMSIDLTRAAVAAQGQHDPLDGYVTYVQLHTTAKTAPADFRLPAIDGLADELVASIELSDLHTTDPLGLGGLLLDAARIEQLAGAGAFRNEDLAASVLATAASGLAAYEGSGGPQREIGSRLPFRELGLVLGLRALELLAEHASGLRASTQLLKAYAPLAAEIERFWQDSRNREAANWTAYRDINDVTLAAALAPAGFVELLPPSRADEAQPQRVAH